MKYNTFFRDNQGSIVVMGAAAVVMLMVAAGAAVDISRYVTVQSKFRNAIDASLLSTASVHRTHEENINEVATKFFEVNFPAEYMETFALEGINVVTDPTDYTWTMEATGKMKTTFSAMLGFDDVTISHKSQVKWDVDQTINAVFTFDTSASMCTKIRRVEREDSDQYAIEYTPDGKCEKLESAKEALNYVIDNAFPSVAGAQPNIFMGIVPFNHKVKFPDTGKIPPEMQAVEARNPIGGDFGNNITYSLQSAGEGYYTNFSDAEPLSQLISLTRVDGDAAKEKLKDQVNAVTQGPHGLGWTRSNIGAFTAALMLDPEYHEYFGGDKPAAFSDKADKIVVMMTDGANIGCCWFSHPYGTFENQYMYLYEGDNAHLTGLDNSSAWANQWKEQYNIPDKGLCERMKEKGITIYTVIFDVNDHDPGGKEIKDVYKKCASNSQFYFDVKNGEELKLAYKTITQSFLKLRLTY